MGVLYTAKAQVTGGRAQGRARTPDGRLDVAIEPPSELGGAGQEATNPEQLFAAGYGACFLSALRTVAAAREVPADDFAIDAEVDLVQDERRRFGLAVRLRAAMPGVADDEAEKMLRLAHRGCPYSRATRGNIDVTLLLGDRRVALETV